MQHPCPKCCPHHTAVRRRKSRGGAHSVFEAASDTLDVFALPAAAEAGGPLPRPKSGRPGWGIMNRRASTQGHGDAAAAAAATAAQHQVEADLHAAHQLAGRQGEELQSLRAQLAAAQAAARRAQERHNMQAFKFELLVDLVRLVCSACLWPAARLPPPAMTPMPPLLRTTPGCSGPCGCWTMRSRGPRLAEDVTIGPSPV